MTKTELAARFPWIDPTIGYPSSDLIPGVEKIDHYFAVKHGGSHKSVPWYSAVADGVLDRDEFEWELFRASLRGTIEGQEYYWGSFVLGLGLFHLMVPVEFTREPTNEEKARWSEKRIGIHGSHSGNFSYSVPSPSFD